MTLNIDGADGNIALDIGDTVNVRLSGTDIASLHAEAGEVCAGCYLHTGDSDGCPMCDFCQGKIVLKEKEEDV